MPQQFDARAWRAANPQKYQAHKMTQRLKQYGLSVSEFTALLAAQEGKCPVCDECLPNEPHLIHIDHSHATGKVRGILCRLCNIGLGYFQDDTARMERAIQYVSKSK